MFAQKILDGERVRETVVLKSLSLIMHTNHNSGVIDYTSQSHVLGTVTFVAMDDAVVHRFCCRNQKFVEMVFIEVSEAFRLQKKFLDFCDLLRVAFQNKNCCM